jgi:GntR family galactonate operon transcriptional repressor
MLVTVAMEVKLQTLPKQVAGVLARRIATGGISGRIGPSEQQILQEFGVSRAVAREALKILAALDIVEIAQGRRVVLRPADEWDYLSPLLIDWLPQEQIRELLAEAHATRLIIEPAIAAIAAKHMTKERLTHLGTLLTAMSANEHDPDAYLKLDLDFHMEICRAAGNRILDRFMYSSRWWQTASRRISNQVPDALPSATEMHRAIYEALVARNPKRAQEAMHWHLKSTTAVGLPDDPLAD